MPYLRLIATTKPIRSFSDFLCNRLKWNMLKRILPISYIPGIRIKIKDNSSLQNGKWYLRPGSVRALLQFSCCFAKLVQRNSMNIGKYFQRSETYKVDKRVHTSIGVVALVIARIFRGKEPKTIPPC